MVDESSQEFLRACAQDTQEGKGWRRPMGRARPIRQRRRTNSSSSCPPDCTDADAIGLRFSAEFADVLRYVADWNRWMLWDRTCVAAGQHSLRVYDLIRKTIRAIGPEAPDERVRRQTGGGVHLHRRDRETRPSPTADIALAADNWDADPWLLNTPNGVVNLETGLTRPGTDPAYLMTKCARRRTRHGRGLPALDAFSSRTRHRQ